MILRPTWIFVHVPKTGGISIDMALGGKTRSVSRHTPLKCVAKGNRFAFGFIRNPWERKVSLYRYLCQKRFERGDNFNQQEVRQMGFKRWLMEDEFFMMEDDHPTGEPWVMRKYWRSDSGHDLPPMQRRPQLWWLEGCDFIGRFERLRDDFREAVRRAKVRAEPIGHRNRTTGGDWRDEHDDETVAFIAEHFAPDIAAFGYEAPF